MVSTLPGPKSAPLLVRRARHVAIAVSLLAALLLVVSSSVDADEYPSHPIRIIVPFAAGGPSDTAGRIAATLLISHIGQNVYVENRTGGGGMIGTEAVASAPADGYSLLLSDAAAFIVVPIVQKATYDTAKEFVGLGQVASAPQALVVSKDSDFKSVRGLVDYAKQNPGKLSFGSAGIGTTTHISLLLLQRSTGISVVHVPYRGTSLSIADVMGGNIQAVFGDAATLAPLVKDGKVRALATTGDVRAPVLPDAPTMAELGFPNVRMVNWFGLHVSSATPPGIVSQLRSAVAAMQADPEFATRLAKIGTSMGTVGAEAFEAMVAQWREQLEPVVRSLGSP